MDRQCKGVARGALALWKRPRLVSEVREAPLQVHRYRVVDLRLDASLPQVGLQLIAPIDANDVLIEDVTIGLHARNRDGPRWSAQSGRREQPVVPIRVSLAGDS